MTVSEKAAEVVERALFANFTSPNECDSNLEPANVVDGLLAIARSIDRLARAMERER